MKKHFYAFLFAAVACFQTCMVGCSSKEPQVIELTDDAIQRYEDLDKDIQKSTGGKYGE